MKPAFTWLVFFSLVQRMPNPAEGGVSGSVHPPERSSWSSSSSPLLPVDVLPVCSHCLNLSTSKPVVTLFRLRFYLMVKRFEKEDLLYAHEDFCSFRSVWTISVYKWRTLISKIEVPQMNEETSPLDMICNLTLYHDEYISSSYKYFNTFDHRKVKILAQPLTDMYNPEISLPWPTTSRPHPSLRVLPSGSGNGVSGAARSSSRRQFSQEKGINIPNRQLAETLSPPSPMGGPFKCKITTKKKIGGEREAKSGNFPVR